MIIYPDHYKGVHYGMDVHKPYAILWHEPRGTKNTPVAGYGGLYYLGCWD